MKESKRVTKFRLGIIKAIPKFPNNRETKAKLSSMSLSILLIHYLSWASRYITVTSRKIVVEPTVTNDRRYRNLKLNIETLLEKARAGKDLNPHLSLLSHSRGFTPAAYEKGAKADRWADKDFLLNAMGYHHFHLGIKMEEKGHVERTDEVLFARVSRETFNAIGIFDHSVFESVGECISPERKRLWKIFDEHTTRGAPPGSVILVSPIATSGHPLHLTSTAQNYSWVIHKIDPKLDNRSFIEELYLGAGIEVPNKPIFEWALRISDLGICEKKHGHFFMLRRGFN
jgi:hypothetical protein